MVGKLRKGSKLLLEAISILLHLKVFSLQLPKIILALWPHSPHPRSPIPTPTLTYEEYLLKIFILPPIWSNPVKTRHYLSACAFCHSLPVGLDILSSYIYMDNLYEETSW